VKKSTIVLISAIIVCVGGSIVLIYNTRNFLPGSNSTSMVPAAKEADSVLIAYELLPGMEAQFDQNPGSVTPFWNSSRTPNQVNPHLTPEKEASNNRNYYVYKDEFDAQAIIKAAYCTKGLYLYFKIFDDQYPGRLDTNWWNNDAVDFFIDPFSPQELNSDPDRHFPVRNNSLTLSCIQFQAPFLKDGGLDTIYVNSSPAGKLDNATKMQPVQYRKFARNEAFKRLGVKVKSVVLSPNLRVQEWFIPWEIINRQSKKNAPGTAFGFVACYNDIDTVNADNYPKSGKYSFGKITWGGRGNPYEGSSHSIWGMLKLGPTILSELEINDLKKMRIEQLFAANPAVAEEMSSKLPRNIKNPPPKPGLYLYGHFPVYGQEFWVATTSTGNDSQVCFIDKNRNNDFSDDKPAIWQAAIDPVSNKPAQYRTIRDSVIVNGRQIAISMDDSLFKSRKIRIKCENAFTGKVSYDGPEYLIAIGELAIRASGDRSFIIGIDFNQNGYFDAIANPPEILSDIKVPFNVPGSTIRILSLSDDFKTIYYDNFIRQ
jgi:hypothetical protein